MALTLILGGILALGVRCDHAVNGSTTNLLRLISLRCTLGRVYSQSVGP
jgi:hypothetical protein